MKLRKRKKTMKTRTGLVNPFWLPAYKYKNDGRDFHSPGDHGFGCTAIEKNPDGSIKWWDDSAPGRGPAWNDGHHNKYQQGAELKAAWLL
jgi:hypothetical protein